MSRRLLLRLAIVAAFVLVPLFYAVRGSSYADFDTSIDLREFSEGTVSGARGVVQRVFNTHPHGSGSAGGDHGRGEGKGWIDLDEELPLTTYEGGVAGYTVWSNLYLSSGALMVIEPDRDEDKFGRKELPNTRQIISGPKRPEGGYPAADEDRWRVVGEEVARGELGSRANVMRGVTYIFNDPPGPDGYLIYFRHFVLEAFLGASRALASTLRGNTPMPSPKRVWFPHCGQKPSWRDDKGENLWFLSHVLPRATIEDSTAWNDRIASGVPVLLEKVVIVDRWAAHSVGGEPGKWGKMNGNIPSLSAPQSFWEPFRNNMMRALGVDGESRFGSRGLPVVVYVDRQAHKPRLIQEDHSALIEALKTLTPKAEVHVTKLSSMSKSQQVELISRADIIVGVRGEELMNTLWMRASPLSTMIELYEEGGFFREFSIMAQALNHRYVAVQNDKVLDEAGWRALGNKQGPGHDEVAVDGMFLASVIEQLLDGAQ